MPMGVLSTGSNMIDLSLGPPMTWGKKNLPKMRIFPCLHNSKNKTVSFKKSPCINCRAVEWSIYSIWKVVLGFRNFGYDFWGVGADVWKYLLPEWVVPGSWDLATESVRLEWSYCNLVEPCFTLLWIIQSIPQWQFVNYDLVIGVW